MGKNPGEIYSKEFFDGQADGSARSAATVVPRVLSILPAKSVVDVGCGVGTWAAEFLARGVPDVWGVDGDYVDRARLRISPDRFIARDLMKPLQIGRTFDLAVCLEVGEHLPASRARGLVSDLTSLAPCVLFSAAVPHGGGTGHVNEQYIPYWVKLFDEFNYQGIDPIRPWILGDDTVEWFYQQNIVMFVAPQHPLLAKGFPRPQTIIHQDLYEQARHPKLTLKMIATGLPGAILRSFRYHLNPRK
jgi:SAM-dependent methyltransferase